MMELEVGEVVIVVDVGIVVVGKVVVFVREEIIENVVIIVMVVMEVLFVMLMVLLVGVICMIG